MSIGTNSRGSVAVMGGMRAKAKAIQWVRLRRRRNVIQSSIQPALPYSVFMSPPKHHDDDDDDSALSDHHDASESPSSEPDTDEAIVDFKKAKSKNTSRRKIRATAPSNFGATLQSLLNTDAPTTLPLSLQPSVAQRHNHERLEKRVRNVLQVKKKEQEDRGRIRDVIGGWGAEGERGLRKVAQRGGVCLCCSP